MGADGIKADDLRDLNKALGKRFHGMQFFDLDDQEQDWLQHNMENCGMTADEAIDDIMEGPA